MRKIDCDHVRLGPPVRMPCDPNRSMPPFLRRLYGPGIETPEEVIARRRLERLMKERELAVVRPPRPDIEPLPDRHPAA